MRNTVDALTDLCSRRPSPPRSRFESRVTLVPILWYLIFYHNILLTFFQSYSTSKIMTWSNCVRTLGLNLCNGENLHKKWKFDTKIGDRFRLVFKLKEHKCIGFSNDELLGVLSHDLPQMIYLTASEVKCQQRWDLPIYKASNRYQTTYTFRINDQYRSWTLDKRHRQTVHNQTLTLHAAYQSELQWRKSMGFKWKYYNEMGNGYGAHKMIWKRQWRKLKLKSKWSSPCTYQKEMWILYDHAAKHLDTLEQHYDHLFEWEASRRFKQEFGRALESGKNRTETLYIHEMVVSDPSTWFSSPFVVCLSQPISLPIL